MMRSVIISTFILYSNLSALGFKFKAGFHVIIYHLSVLVTVRGERLLRMIPSVCLFTSVHKTNQRYILKPKNISDRSC